MPRKSRNFDGCWTCRSRKVKCDLARPVCTRCKKANLECAGYNIVLGWSRPLTVSSTGMTLLADVEDDVENDNFQRRNVELVKFPKHMRYESYQEVAQRLEEIDAHAINLKSNPFVEGPFSVYPLYFKEEPALKKKKRQEASPEPVYERLDHNDIVPSFAKGEALWVHPQLMDSAKMTIYGLQGLKFKIDEQNMLHILYPKFFPHSNVDNYFGSQSITKKIYETDNDNLIVKSLFRILVSSLSSYLFSFIKTFFVRNYYEMVLIEHIKQVINECVLYEDAFWKPFLDRRKDATAAELRGNIKVAIAFCALGLSSFLKAHEQPLTSEYWDVAIELRKLSIDIVNYHLDEYDTNMDLMDKYDYSYETNLIIAIVLQFQLDSYFSIFENLSSMFAIGEYVIASKFQEPNLSPIVRLAVDTFLVLKVFFESTEPVFQFNYEISERDRRINYEDLSDNYDLGSSDEDSSDDEKDEPVNEPRDSDESDRDNDSHDDVSRFPLGLHGKSENFAEERKLSKLLTLSNFERDSIPPEMTQKFTPQLNSNILINSVTVCLLFGLPRSFLELLSEVTHLANHKCLFRLKKVLPRNFPRITAEVEDRLLNWTCEKYWNLYIPGTTKENGKPSFISPYHEWLHYHVECFLNALLVYFYTIIREFPVHRYQEYVKNSLDNFEKLLEITPPKGLELKPLFWPLLISGSCVMEMGERKRVVKLWSHPAVSQLNYWRAKQIILELWARRDENEKVLWLDMVREWEISLCWV